MFLFAVLTSSSDLLIPLQHYFIYDFCLKWHFISFCSARSMSVKFITCLSSSAMLNAWQMEHGVCEGQPLCWTGLRLPAKLGQTCKSVDGSVLYGVRLSSVVLGQRKMSSILTAMYFRPFAMGQHMSIDMVAHGAHHLCHARVPYFHSRKRPTYPLLIWRTHCTQKLWHTQAGPTRFLLHWN